VGDDVTKQLLTTEFRAMVRYIVPRLIQTFPRLILLSSSSDLLWAAEQYIWQCHRDYTPADQPTNQPT